MLHTGAVVEIMRADVMTRRHLVVHGDISTRTMRPDRLFKGDTCCKATVHLVDGLHFIRVETGIVIVLLFNSVLLWLIHGCRFSRHLLLAHRYVLLFLGSIVDHLIIRQSTCIVVHDGSRLAETVVFMRHNLACFGVRLFFRLHTRNMTLSHLI